MEKKTPVTRDYKAIGVQAERFRRLRRGSARLFRIIFVSLAAAVFLYNQYVLTQVAKTVDELKRSLVLDDTELSVKRMLDEGGRERLTELQRIKITKLIVFREGEGLDPFFTVDLIRRESSYHPGAISPVGAVGLMQLLPTTARWLAKREGIAWRSEEMLFDPVTNVRLGTAYLVHLRREFEGERWLRAAYQQGPTRVRARVKGGQMYAGNR